MKRMLLVGPNGSGKISVARAIHTAYANTLWWTNKDVRVEASWIHTGAGLLQDGMTLDTMPSPFRAPHHTCSSDGMIGTEIKGRVRPGECSLAHGGVLLLDELDEWRTSTIEAIAWVLRNGASPSPTIPACPAFLVATSRTLCSRTIRHARILEIAQ